MATTKTQPATLPRPLPVFGHTLRFKRQPLEFLESLRPLGDVVTIRLGWKPAYIVNSPDLIRRVLVVEAPAFEGGCPAGKGQAGHRQRVDHVAWRGSPAAPPTAAARFSPQRGGYGDDGA